MNNGSGPAFRMGVLLEPGNGWKSRRNGWGRWLALGRGGWCGGEGQVDGEDGVG